MSEIDVWLREADLHSQSGRLDEAETLYRRALEREPGSGVIRFHLGCLYVRAGRPIDGIHDLEVAARMLPNVAAAHIVLGNALISSGRWNDAVEALTRAVMLEPGFLPAKSNLALALFSCGRADDSEALYREILASNPDNQDAHSNLAHILNHQKRFDEAESHARVAVDLPPSSAAAANILGASLYGLGRTDEAETAFRQSIALDPRVPQTHVNLFNALRARQRFAEAELAARDALQVNPNYEPGLDAVGLALIDLERFEEAIDHFDRATRIYPESATLVQHMALACSRQGLYEEAVRFGLRAVELDPTPDARFSLSLDQIRTGRYPEGWLNHERRASSMVLPTLFGVPKWEGDALDGRALYVFAEGGLGDAIQFARFLPLLVERANGELVFECLRGGVDLLGDIPGVAKIGSFLRDADGAVTRDSPSLAGCNACYLSLLSAPALFGLTEETMPSAKLPLRAPEDARIAWRERLGGRPGLNVGLCWSGGPVYYDDRYRSTSLGSFAPLSSVGGVNLVSLQLGPPADEIRSIPHGLEILHLPGELSPIGKTAALILELDLVISVDTSIAHLAGALGVETWLLLPFVSHWVWNVNRPFDTPWYPGHRLFRQPRHGDWPAVIDRVVRELRGRSEGGSAADAYR